MRENVLRTKTSIHVYEQKIEGRVAAAYKSSTRKPPPEEGNYLVQGAAERSSLKQNSGKHYAKGDQWVHLSKLEASWIRRLGVSVVLNVGTWHCTDVNDMTDILYLSFSCISRRHPWLQCQKK